MSIIKTDTEKIYRFLEKNWWVLLALFGTVAIQIILDYRWGWGYTFGYTLGFIFTVGAITSFLKGIKGSLFSIIAYLMITLYLRQEHSETFFFLRSMASMFGFVTAVILLGYATEKRWAAEALLEAEANRISASFLENYYRANEHLTYLQAEVAKTYADNEDRRVHLNEELEKIRDAIVHPATILSAARMVATDIKVMRQED